MIKCNLSKFMGIHKMSIQDVHERTGLNRATISNLYHEKVNRIDFETMEKLCKLFNCQAGPGELFEYVAEEEDK
jgi:putative transcriptional regulator